MPIGADMASRVHECGSEEDQARLVYALRSRLHARERGVCRDFLKPAGLMRWGLAEEFERMRRLARSEAMGRMLQLERWRVTESLSHRRGHMWAMALIRPSFVHLYWAVCVSVSLCWLGAGAEGAEGAAGVASAALAALLAGLCKGFVYVWQDSSSSMPEEIMAVGWGRNPRASAIAMLSEMRAGCS